MPVTVEDSFDCPECCGGLIVQCRSDADFATLCGFSEYTSPSTPKKKYRKESISGSVTLNAAPPGCTTFGTWTATLSGYCEYLVTDCSSNNLGFQVVTGVCTNCTGEPAAGTYAQCGIPNYVDTEAPVETPTTRTSTTHAAPGVHCKDGTFQSALTDEDTEDDASRRAAGDPEAWIVADLCTDVFTFATGRLPGDPFSFGYQRVQVRAFVFDLANGTYNLRFHFGDRPAGTFGAFIDTGAGLDATVTKSGGDLWTDWYDVTLDRDKEYQVISCIIVP